MRIALVALLLVACSPGPVAIDGGSVGDADVGDACGRDFTACGGSCVNAFIDRDHCGGCDIACSSSQICNMGVCE